MNKCPICELKLLNCDCTSKEREQYYEIERLTEEIDKLKEELKRKYMEEIESKEKSNDKS